MALARFYRLAAVVRPGGFKAALLALVAVASVLLGCGPASEAPTPAAETSEGARTAQYVGDATCASCHADLAAAYAQTNKAHALTRFDPATAPERFGPGGRSPVVYNEAFDLYYQAFVRGDTLYQREFRRDPDGTVSHELVYPASHVIGSGHATRSYLMTVEAEGGGYLTEMPLTWYVERELWAMSPGYTRSNNRFGRAITAECIACHAGVPEHTPFSVNHFTNAGGGISCERCHGPGSAHVAAWQGDPHGMAEEPDPTIVNPAHLSVDLQLDVCQQCHLEGTTIFQPGEDALSYRPGTPLRAHRTVFATESSLDAPEAFGIASHAVRLRLSACFTETQGTPAAMTCTTCHDPHRPAEALPADHFNASCRSCHGGDTSGMGAHEAVCSRPDVDADAPDAHVLAAQGDCVSCHLQQAGTSDIPHVTFTDHWIRRELPEARASVETALVTLTRTTPFRLVDVTAADQGMSASPEAPAVEAQRLLDAGLAIFKFYEATHRLPAYLPQAVDRLRRGLALGGTHPDARVTLGRALAALDSTGAALALLREATAATPEHAWAHYWLGHTLHAAGRSAEAVAALDRAVALAPTLVEAHLKRGEALSAAGRPADALAAWRAGLALDPEHHPSGWNNLGFALLQQQDLDAAETALTRAVALDPDYVVARANLGTALLVTERLDAAAEQFERALATDPAYAPALGNLGVVRAQQGRPAEARRLFERLLAIDPDDQRARAYLAQLDD